MTLQSAACARSFLGRSFYFESGGGGGVGGVGGFVTMESSVFVVTKCLVVVIDT